MEASEKWLQTSPGILPGLLIQIEGTLWASVP